MLVFKKKRYGSLTWPCLISLVHLIIRLKKTSIVNKANKEKLAIINYKKWPAISYLEGKKNLLGDSLLFYKDITNTVLTLL